MSERHGREACCPFFSGEKWRAGSRSSEMKTRFGCDSFFAGPVLWSGDFWMVCDVFHFNFVSMVYAQCWFNFYILFMSNAISVERVTRTNCTNDVASTCSCTVPVSALY